MKTSQLFVIVAGCLLVTQCKPLPKSPGGGAGEQFAADEQKNKDEPQDLVNRGAPKAPPSDEPKDTDTSKEKEGELSGAWLRDCYDVPGMKFHRVDKLQVEGEKMTYERIVYEDEDCKTVNSNWVWELTYKLGETVKVDNDATGADVDAKELDITYVKLTRSIASQDKLDSVHEDTKYFEYPGKDWKLDEPKDITGKAEEGQKQKAKGDVDKIFVIIDGDSLTLPGDDDANDLFREPAYKERKTVMKREAKFTRNK
jgi:hypothetical protein